jgi:hypothetical protein
MKIRQNPFDERVIASMTTSGVVNLYGVKSLREAERSASLVGKLHGLQEETFSLNWSRVQSNLLASAAGTNICIWDVNRLSGDANESMPLGENFMLNKIMRAHGSA